MVNYYEVLQLPREASLADIEASYKRLCREVDFETDFRSARKLEKAYKNLIDPALRRVHDESLLASSEAPSDAPSSAKPDELARAEYRGLIKAMFGTHIPLTPEQDKSLEKERVRLGLSVADAVKIRQECAGAQQLGKGALLKRRSCPRCGAKVTQTDRAHCPNCELELVLCPNRDCHAIHHAKELRECAYCGAPLTWETRGSVFRGNNARTGEARGEIVQAVEFAWCAPLETPVRAAPVAAFGYLYVGTTTGQLHALTRTGCPLKSKGGDCEFPRVLSGGAIMAAPVLVNGTLHVATVGGNLYAIDAWTGRDRQRELFLEQGVVATPLYHKDNLYIATLAGRLLAVRADTMSIAWAYPSEDEPPLGRFLASPTLFGEMVVAVDEHGTVIALKSSAGRPQLLWRQELKARILGTPLARNHELCLYASDGRLFTLRQDGTLCYSGNELHSYVEGSPASWGGGMLLVGSGNGRLYAQDPLTGSIHASYPIETATAGTLDPIQSSPLCIGDWVFYGGEAGYMYGAKAPEARIAWSYRLGAATRTSPTYDGHQLYVGDDHGNVYAFSIRKGGS